MEPYLSEIYSFHSPEKSVQYTQISGKRSIMKFSLIFILLSLPVFLSAFAGGWLYYYFLKKAAITEAEQQADIHLKNILKHL